MITRYDPDTIVLGGTPTSINDLAASEAITPGHLIERHNSASVIRWRKHATAAVATGRVVAVEQLMLNKGVDDAYAAGDLVQAAALPSGAVAWMWIASGQNISAGNKLESAGNGTLRILASGVALFVALENKPNVTELTRIRVEVVE